MNKTALHFRRFLFVAISLLLVFYKVNPALALFCGILSSLVLQPLQLYQQSKITKFLLGLCVVGLAAGIHTEAMFELGTKGLILVCMAIISSVLLGYLLTLLFKIPAKIACLLTVGTAICGGSAIVAVAPIIDADSEELGTAIAIVFLLNALAMFLFPWIGHYYNMSQIDFGIWSAIAIHDTASVVGTAVIYGDQAVSTATTAKLVRTLFLIPAVALIASYMRKAKNNRPSLGIPWFVKGFAVMLFAGWIFPGLWGFGDPIAATSKRLIVLALYLVGANIKIETLKQLQLRPLVFAVAIWFTLSTFYFYVLSVTA
jgi:uncharacterized integral membrane protein (TIGR00698 family)